MARNVKTAVKAPIYFLCGEDEPTLKRAAQELRARLAPEDEMNYEVVDGQAENVDGAAVSISRLREAILTLPFFGGGKLVWWKNVNFLDESGVGRFASVKEALEPLVDDLKTVDGEMVTLIITARAAHKGRAFTKALLKMAEAKYFDLPDLRNMSEEQVIDMIATRMEAAGLRVGAGAAERFYEAAGLNTSMWQREIEKLVCYSGEEKKEVTRADVELMVSETREVVIWDFCTDVLKGNSLGAMNGLRSLFAQEETEIGILSMLIGQVRLAALGSVLKEEKMMRVTNRGNYVSAELMGDADAFLPKKKSGESISTFALGKATASAARKPSAFWVAALGESYKAYRKMITGVGDKRRVLEQLVLEIVVG